MAIKWPLSDVNINATAKKAVYKLEVSTPISRKHFRVLDWLEIFL